MTKYGPIARRLIEEGLIYEDEQDMALVGRASDGAKVTIASLMDDPKGIEGYLTKHPTPDTW